MATDLKRIIRPLPTVSEDIPHHLAFQSLPLTEAERLSQIDGFVQTTEREIFQLIKSRRLYYEPDGNLKSTLLGDDRYLAQTKAMYPRGTDTLTRSHLGWNLFFGALSTAALGIEMARTRRRCNDNNSISIEQVVPLLNGRYWALGGQVLENVPYLGEYAEGFLAQWYSPLRPLDDYGILEGLSGQYWHYVLKPLFYVESLLADEGRSYDSWDKALFRVIQLAADQGRGIRRRIMDLYQLAGLHNRLRIPKPFYDYVPSAGEYFCFIDNIGAGQCGGKPGIIMG